MAILLDTQIFYAVAQNTLQSLPPGIAHLLLKVKPKVAVSVVSLWEIAIKRRLSKLGLQMELKLLPGLIRSHGFELLQINENHVLAEIAPELKHRDPFDRLLLGVCAVEDIKLVTVDLALVEHPLAWRES
jgi:PIN domain nuclease of toxin-antitoxin system